MTFDPLAVDVPRMLAELGIDAQHRHDQWVARCPSGRHPDKRPSWEIIDRPGDEKHGLHTCRSCHWGGTALELVRQSLGLAGFREAVRWIEEHALGTPRTLERLTVRVRKVVNRDAFRLPAEVLVLPIHLWAPTPRDYLLQDRKVAAWQVARWGIGYAVDGKLRGRIVFPARDNEGRLLNYTGRTFVGSMVRYRSAPEDEGPDTSAVFGELHWPRIDARRQSLVFVTEGALNALAVERAMVREVDGRAVCPAVAALSGSKVQLEQVLKVASFAGAVVLTDPDPAGEAARERIEGALVRHVSVLHVRFPAGQDAASVETIALREMIRTCLSRTLAT